VYSEHKLDDPELAYDNGDETDHSNPVLSTIQGR